MLSTDTLYIGIDPTSGRKEFGYAVLDGNLGLVKLADADTDEMIAFLGEHESVIAAVNAPAQVNQGLVKKKLTRESSKPDRILRGVDMRLAEYDLRERGISIARTPSREESCVAWMQVGFALYRKLSELGFSSLDVEYANRKVFETHPYASYCALAESIPFPKPTLEGRLQRQSILYDKGVRINDPMEFFQEITRFKLTKGILPSDLLCTPEQLDVLVAAYTAWLAMDRPDEITRIGDKSEGQIILPVRDLKNKY
jgi:predicted nuclease with RNAse H fold